MKMEFKLQRNRYVIAKSKIIGVSILMIFLLFAGYSIVSGSNSTSVISAEKFIEKIAEIEIWAKTFIDLKTNRDSVSAVLLLDNGTTVSNQELSFYLNESFIKSELTNSDGRVEIFFSEYNLSDGNYSFKSIFQGNQTLFFNASSVEKQIEIFRTNETNQTLLNETDEINISLDGMICKEFTDSVLFSSGYSNDKKGSTNYETWKVQTNCSDAGGENCSLHNVNTKSRILYSNPYNDESAEAGYVQISKLNSFDCDSPERKEYSDYLVQDIPKQKDSEWERYCKKNETSDSKCNFEDSCNQQEESICYGIKTYAPQYSILDVVEISYTWCWEGDDE